MENYTIAEDFTLPSLGKVYGNQRVNPNVKIRSMTTEDEMRLLSPSNLPYKNMVDLIENCLVEKPGIPVYDLCMQDYEFLMHKLRIVTYGDDYKIKYKCPICGKEKEEIINMGKMKVKEYDDKLDEYFNIQLPITKKNIQLRLKTPRVLDNIDIKKKEDEKNSRGNNFSLYELKSNIYKIDGEVMNDFELEKFLRKLPMRDTNYIRKSVEKIKFGIDTVLNIYCPNCGEIKDIIFPINVEFFSPSID